MTYIKPEAASNQYLDPVEAILHLGANAAKEENWLSVYNYLQQLPQTKSRKKQKRFVINKEQWQMTFDIALKMLIEADFQHKWSIVKLFPLLGEDIIPNLSSLVKDDKTEADVRWFICQILGNFNCVAVIITLVELIDSADDRELVAIAGKTLTKIGDGAVDALENLLAKPQHRVLAVQSLYYIRTAKTIEPLLKVAIAPEPELRAIAIQALGSFHDSRIPPVLIKALEDQASNVRKEAATALGFRPDLREELGLIDCLRPLLHDFNLEVCCQSAIALCRMKHETAAIAMFEVLQAETTPISLKLDLIKALSWSEISPAIEYLGKALVESTGVVTQEIITVLGRTAIDELKLLAAEVLVDFWQSQNQRLELAQHRQALASSLGELRCGCGRETLEQLALDSDSKVKLYAASALRKIDAGC
ncbi:MAG: HEAT repeat domain-containing protein [Cyanobacteria bacterium P01_G01_bin.19]